MGRWYVPHPSATLADLGIESDSINPANDPVTQEAGAWITPAAVEKVEAAGLGPCFDAHAFIARHLEALLLRNLADFLDAQEVQRLLDEWSKEPGGAALIRRGLPDVRAQLRFGRMLRALLAERVPIRRWRDMFEVLGPEANFSDDIADLLIDVRLQLRDELAAAAAQREHHDLPESLENDLMPWLTRHDGVTFLAMPPEQTQEALSEIRELLPTGDCVLVVQHQEIRHSVWRLVQLEFPRAMVVTRAELHAGESIAQSAAEATRESVGASV
jgi:flagellar biosynthesis component FlhA